MTARTNSAAGWTAHGHRLSGDWTCSSSVMNRPRAIHELLWETAVNAVIDQLVRAEHPGRVGAGQRGTTAAALSLAGRAVRVGPFGPTTRVGVEAFGASRPLRRSLTSPTGSTSTPPSAGPLIAPTGARVDTTASARPRTSGRTAGHRDRRRGRQRQRAPGQRSAVRADRERAYRPLGHSLRLVDDRARRPAVAPAALHARTRSSPEHGQRCGEACGPRGGGHRAHRPACSWPTPGVVHGRARRACRRKWEMCVEGVFDA